MSSPETAAAAGWATQQLAEFLAGLTGAADAEAAVGDALERLAESFEADAGAFIRDGRVTASLGWAAGVLPEAEILLAAGTDRAALDVAGVGWCETIAIPVDQISSSSLLLARAQFRFSPLEVGLLRGMTRVLGLGLRLLGSVAEERKHAEDNHNLLASLRGRHALLERLAGIQRQITSRVPLREVLDAISAAAVELLGVDLAVVQLLDGVSPGTGQVASVAPRPAAPGVGGGLTVDGMPSSLTAPIHLPDGPAGVIAVGSYRTDRSFLASERELLLTLAEHAGLALNDARAVQAKDNALAEATYQAMHDELTGLPNRACFYDRLGQALRQATRDGASTAVLLFDLDRFKEINDTLGHKYGDRVLREIGPRIRQGLREPDTLARLGGDEFCVLLPSVDGLGAALQVAERIITSLEQPFDIDGMSLGVEASCGIALAPDDGDSADLLLQRADVAMYVAKDSHAPVVCYNAALNINTPGRLAMLGELRTAISHDQLVLHYQPKAALDSGRVEGVEALVRWQHPTLGLVPPDEFIPLAEHTGLIKPLTSWVLNTALAQLRRWRDDAPVPDGAELSIALNVSTRSLLDDAFPAEVVAACERWRIPPHLVELEITESAIIADPGRARLLLTELAAAGVKIAIDDFGTGYSSLAYLKNLPVRQLKIDRSFILHMRQDANDEIIVRSVIDLGHNLGLQTVAEGIEDLDTWRALARLGCDSAQGYFLARPMPAEQVSAWLVAAALLAETATAGQPAG
jgi:diguanylate cyclase (GGDEF)-like protein